MMELIINIKKKKKKKLSSLILRNFIMVDDSQIKDIFQKIIDVPKCLPSVVIIGYVFPEKVAFKVLRA